MRYRLVLVAACVLAPAKLLPAQDTLQTAIVQSLEVAGASEQSETAVIRASGVTVYEPLGMTLDQLRARIERYYHEAGYSFARVTPTFDVATGALTLQVDEGVIDGVEFNGVDAKIARAFSEDYALRAGDVFNRARAGHALDVLLRQTRGAVRRSRETFDIVDRNGQRILVVGLREPAGRFRLVPDLGDREDWFTSVDGFVPSLGVGAAVFDDDSFNHSFVAGHLSTKLASEKVGYALGFERPFFRVRKLYLGGEIHDLTATDDQWQLTGTEASLAAIGPRRSYRDYYRRRGIQITSAYRVRPSVDLLLAWRGERQEPLQVHSNFSFWDRDEPFRPNVQATDGRLSALVIGASIDPHGFDDESLEATYRRHQLDSLFGLRLPGPERDSDLSARWRIDWTSELSSPHALQSDFDFRRHILAGRAELPLSEHQEVDVRAIGGWSEGLLPPQRQFAIGGIGTVHGYAFDQEVGTSLALLNLEYALGDRTGLRAIGFFDVGRVAGDTSPSPWLKGVGFGIGLGGMRVDFGYRLTNLPSSLQVVLRFVRTF